MAASLWPAIALGQIAQSPFLAKLQAALSQVITLSGTAGLLMLEPSPAAAAGAAGFALQLPATLPNSLALTDVVLITGRAMNVSSSVESLPLIDALLDFLAPASFESPSYTVTASPLVEVDYQSGGTYSSLLQTSAAGVVVPPGVDLGLVVELRLVLLGVPPRTAAQLARAVDWRTAMLVPLPSNIASIKTIALHGGQPAVLIQTSASATQPSQSYLLWSTYYQLYGMTSNGSPADLVTMAQSVQ